MFALESTLQRKMPKRLLFSRHGTGWIPYEEACPQKRQTVRKRGTSSRALIYRYKVALCRTFQTRCLQRRSKDFGTRWNRSRRWNIHGTPFSSFQRAVHACTVGTRLFSSELVCFQKLAYTAEHSVSLQADYIVFDFVSGFFKQSADFFPEILTSSC